MRDKKYQIFVSSTFEDLKKEREEVTKGILDAGHIPAGMELFGGAGEVINIIKRWIDDSDIYLLLLGGKYGSIYEEKGIGYTQWEYEYASSINKPIAIIQLSESMLLRNAVELGKDVVFETKNKDKYDDFVKLTTQKNIRIMVDDRSQIKGAVYSQLDKIISEKYPKYNLTGWIRADSVARDWNKMTIKQLEEQNVELLSSYIKKYYYMDIRDLASSVSSNLVQTLTARGILNSMSRFVKINKYGRNLVKVNIIDSYDYCYLDSEHKAFGKRFQATKQQAETYKIEKLIINGVEYTKQVELKISEDINRGQLNYYVETEKSIPIKDNMPVVIDIQSSYVCPPQDFFQAYGLPFPCKEFNVNISLDDGLDKMYTILSSTYSSFSKAYSDSYKANEMKNFGICSLRFKEWMLPGVGYVATIKKRTENNH